MISNALALCAAGILALVCLPATAQETATETETEAEVESRHSVVWTDTTVFRYNPLGMITAGELEYRLRLYNTSHPLFATNYVSLAATPILTPAFTRLGAKFEVMPLSVLRLGVRYEFIQYFGAFDYFQSFDDPLADVSEDTIEANGEANENYVTNGTQLSFLLLLQAKVGPIAVRTKATLFHNEYDVTEGDTVFYDPFTDIMLPASGWAFTNDLDALYLRERLVAGLRYTTVQTFLPGVETADDPNGPIHRIGPLVVYTVHEGSGALESIKVLGLFQWHLTHRYRAGQEVTRALPYLGVGAIFAGRLL